jgi:tetratricopeptide (TPR) repeat protein
VTEKTSSEAQEEVQRKDGEETAEEDSFDEDFVTLGILNLFGDEIKPDASAHRAVAQVLVEADFHEPAERTCKTALELCKPIDEEWYRSSCFLSDILLLRKKKKEAHQVMIEAVAQLSSNNISPSLKRLVYAACARAQKKRHHYDAAIESYGKGKTADPDGITPAADLVDELDVVDKKQDKAEYIRNLKSWSLLERITWIVSNYSADNKGRLERFCDIASDTCEQEFIVNFYQEAITLLDNLEAGTPLRIDLAYIHLYVCRDPEKALAILDQVFDSRSTSFWFPITGAVSSDTDTRAVYWMAIVQLELFRNSRDPIYKGRCLDSLTGLMQRPFPLDVPQESPFYTSQRRVSLSYMYMVMGPLNKFQEVVQSLLDDSFTGLSDSVGWNDNQYLGVLAQTLGLLSLALRKDERLQRYARIVGSALFSKLSNIKLTSDGDPEEATTTAKKAIKTGQENITEGQVKMEDQEGRTESDSDENEVGEAPEEDGDLIKPGVSLYTCEGFCQPKRKFYYWGGQSAYFYPALSTGLICEECQAAYEAVRRGERKLKGRYFYGIEHTYFKLPIEGWRGVRDGMLMIEGEEPVAMDDFLEKIRTEVCQEAWDRLWAGDI